MAKILYEVTKDQTSFKQVNWSLGGADYGTPHEMPEYSDKTIQIAGTFGGATVTVYGSNLDSDVALEPTVAGSWIVLKDVNNANVSATADAGFTAVNNYTYITCRSTGGTGSDIIVAINGKKVN